MKRQKDIVINEWKEGVASSPLLGYNMRNVDIDDVSGIVKINYKTQLNSDFVANNALTGDNFTVPTAGATNELITLAEEQDIPNGTGLTFTNSGGSGDSQSFECDNPGGDFIILDAAQNLTTGVAVTFTEDSPGDLPEPLLEATTYYLKKFSNTTYEVYTDSALTSLVNITTTGIGNVHWTASLPLPLVEGTAYYTYKVTNTTYKLMTDYDDTLTGDNPLRITNEGTGTHSYNVSTIGKVNIFLGSGLERYAVDENNLVWKFGGGDAWGLIAGNNSGTGAGAILWKNHILVASANRVDAYNLGTKVWTKNLTGSNWTGSAHYMHIGADDRVYIADGNLLARISEVDGQTFDAANSGTYSASNNVLDLPSNESITSIVTLGVDLVLGTNNSKLYRWDRVSSSFYNPLRVEAGSIDAMVVLNNLIYIFPSGTTTNWGKIYVSDGNSIEKIAEIPRYLVGEIRTGNSPTFSPTSVYIKDAKIYFTIGGQGDIGGSGRPAAQFAGVWSLNTKGVLNFEHEVSTGEVGQNGISFGGSDANYLSYSISSNNYVDDIKTTRYTSYKAFIETPLIRIGTFNQPNTIRQFDVYFAEPLAVTGEGIRLKVRDDRSATYTTIGEATYANNGGIQKYSFDYLYEGENIQLKAELTTGGDSSATPELMEIRLR